jgi:hypothetical protein
MFWTCPHDLLYVSGNHQPVDPSQLKLSKNKDLHDEG